MTLPKLVFDHIAIIARTLDEGASYVSEHLGIDMPIGGEHPFMGTHNLLLSLGDMEFLEVIAIDPDGPQPDRPRWFNLDRFDGTPKIGAWIVGSRDITADFSKKHGEIINMTRGDLKWQITVRNDGRLVSNGAFPQLIQWPDDIHPASRMEKRGCTLKSFEITHPDAVEISNFLDVTFNDERIKIAEGQPAFKAVFETPTGAKTLS
ncbi:VOC family protein [Lentilitoribacter sp. Alg239-R112]|uniref:VOC family protein n=1 Tax=Lentilitoribacter sp. Alg239-R112 TaxID=2305987 RepID=UPI0013A6A7E9|nr:VOC family protein [Lentilitoribacter sp. Alg239-R112]